MDLLRVVMRLRHRSAWTGIKQCCIKHYRRYVHSLFAHCVLTPYTGPVSEFFELTAMYTGINQTSHTPYILGPAHWLHSRHIRATAGTFNGKGTHSFATAGSRSAHYSDIC